MRVLLAVFSAVAPAAEDRRQEGPPPGGLLALVDGLVGAGGRGGADLRRAEEEEVGLVVVVGGRGGGGRRVRAGVGAPVRGVGRDGAREQAPVAARGRAAAVEVAALSLVALGGEGEKAVAEAGRADADSVRVGVELAPHLLRIPSLARPPAPRGGGGGILGDDRSKARKLCNR